MRQRRKKKDQFIKLNARQGAPALDFRAALEDDDEEEESFNKIKGKKDKKKKVNAFAALADS